MTNLSASDLAGRRIRQVRERRKWTAKELADRCAEAGAPHITPTVITNLETRRRKTREITVDEVLVLAHVLGVPPLQLIVPAGSGEELEVVPGVHLDDLAAADWIAGAPEQVQLDDIRSPEPGAAALDRWQERIARIVGREARRHRERQKLGAQQLAGRTANLGMPIPRPVLASLESGHRDSVSVSEVLVLAAALGVAPSELICPAGYDDQVEILPGRMVDPLLALRWIDGDLAIDLSGPDVAFAAPGAGEESAPRLLETHAGLIEQVSVNDGEAARTAADVRAAVEEESHAIVVLRRAETAGDAEALEAAQSRVEAARIAADGAHVELRYRTEAAVRYRETAAQSLRYVRAEMSRRGMILPPLPASLNSVTSNGDGQ